MNRDYLCKYKQQLFQNLKYTANNIFAFVIQSVYYSTTDSLLSLFVLFLWFSRCENVWKGKLPSQVKNLKTPVKEKNVTIHYFYLNN